MSVMSGHEFEGPAREAYLDVRDRLGLTGGAGDWTPEQVRQVEAVAAWLQADVDYAKGGDQS